MNSEILIAEASKIMNEWRRLNCRTCFLGIKDGKVVIVDKNDIKVARGFCVPITITQQIYGFSPSGWSVIGSQLFDLYNKEKSCQEQQKP